MAEVSILDRPVMSSREAARQLRIPPSTLIHWLEGGPRQGTMYAPVLREEPTGSRDMTWGEVVEARYLRAYRDKHVSMQQLRAFVGELRSAFGIPYPLAHSKPFITENRRLVVEVQERAKLPQAAWAVIEVKTGQLLLGYDAHDFWERVDFDPETGDALRLLPAGRNSPVVMNPKQSSGAATVRGRRTEILAELVSAGEAIEDVAEDFALSVEDVQAALSYEWAKTA